MRPENGPRKESYFFTPSKLDIFHAYAFSVYLLIHFKSVSLNPGSFQGSFKNTNTQIPLLETLI